MFYPFGVFNFQGYIYVYTTCNIFFERLASLLADKKDVSYSVVMPWLRCRHSVSFSLLCSAIDCLRGARSSKGHPANLQALDLAILLLLLLLLACGLHNHTYIKPRDVQLKMLSHIATAGNYN